ncbi:MAG: hypothetical protein ACO35D_05700, partial [Aquiluna sp.]
AANLQIAEHGVGDASVSVSSANAGQDAECMKPVHFFKCEWVPSRRCLNGIAGASSGALHHVILQFSYSVIYGGSRAKVGILTNQCQLAKEIVW